MRPIHRKALKRAVETCGGVEAVAVALQESTRQVREWLAGEGYVSNDVFLRIVDLLLEKDPAYQAGAAAAYRPEPRQDEKPGREDRT
ncbi:MAG TPA: hypothetical protein VF211_13265 [Burkholderiales bacterium]